MNSEALKIFLERGVIRKINDSVLSHIRFNHSKMFRYNIKGFGSLFSPANSSTRVVRSKINSYQFNSKEL